MISRTYDDGDAFRPVWTALTPEETAAEDARRKAAQRAIEGPRMWCPCHGEGGTYTAMVHGYHVSQDRAQSFPCPQAREI